MRKIIFLVAFFVTNYSCLMGQNDSLISYTYIHEVDLPKTDLFSNAKKWIATSFNNYKAVVSFEDKETGEISGTGEFAFLAGLTTGAKYKFAISTKDGKYRLKIENIELKSLLGIMKEMYTEKVVKYQRHELDSLNSITDSLEKVNTTGFKKSELRSHSNYKEKISTEIKKNLTPKIEPYFIEFDKSLFTTITKKNDF